MYRLSYSADDKQEIGEANLLFIDALAAGTLEVGAAVDGVDEPLVVGPVPGVDHLAGQSAVAVAQHAHLLHLAVRGPMDALVTPPSKTRSVHWLRFPSNFLCWHSCPAVLNWLRWRSTTLVLLKSQRT